MNYLKCCLIKHDTYNLSDEDVAFFSKINVVYVGQFSSFEELMVSRIIDEIDFVIFDSKHMDNIDNEYEGLFAIQKSYGLKIVLVREIDKTKNVLFSYEAPSCNISSKKFNISQNLIKIKTDLENKSKSLRLSLYKLLDEILAKLGFLNGFVGYNYICDCVYVSIKEKDKKITLSSDIYKYVAVMNDCSEYAVERGIRTAFNNAKRICNYKKLEDGDLEYFKNLMLYGSNKSLIKALASYVTHKNMLLM